MSASEVRPDNLAELPPQGRRLALGAAYVMAQLAAHQRKQPVAKTKTNTSEVDHDLRT